MPSAEDNAKTVNRYLELAAEGRADDIADLYADDATVEDPVGGEVHIGREAIRFWALTVDVGGNRMRIEIISTMTFNDEGKIASMKAYWTPENIKQL